MPNIFQIPVQVGTPQTFQISLGGVIYVLTLRYRDDPAGQGGWVLDIADASDNPLIQGIALITGRNLLEPYGYMNFGGRIWVQTTSDPDAVPTFDNLGSDGQIYWVTS